MLPFLLLSLGCARVSKFMAPEDFVSEATPHGELADVRWGTGWRDEPHRNWPPEGRRLPDGRWVRPPADVTSRGWIEVDPLRDDVELSLWVRRTGLDRSGFKRVASVTGSLPGELASELRFVPKQLDEAFRLPMHQLHNVYNDYRFEDGDLLLLEVSSDGHEPERYLFRSQEFGLRTKVGAGVLVRVPLFENDEVSPALALTVSVGHRPRTRRPLMSWVGSQVGLMGSLGVGSTTVANAGTGPVQDELRTFFNAALAGGGIELFDIFSIQVLANLSALTRNELESAATLAVGFDAVQFARSTESAVTRLFGNNALDR